ncbi:unnamed protein product [Rhizophagus irregularis]|uniref:Myb-like domain-containing protein n=1 Tax=Rhizophagus irregularis TaxID=588596 RepID=A0A2N1N264_9GLOM|nr:hypothetical protein RhiirC2_834603 [Rhizophagus irregularis]CAB4383608.1 unnamed protein product [Rhizophagus irregularis]CAB5353065.1 unnamed protein product [Rhizophagus irregularis]
MEMKNHDSADHDIKDHEKIDDVEESESTEEVNKDVARKNTNRIHKTISEEGKKIILDYMKEWIKGGRKPSNPFKILAKNLKDSCDYDYNSKAICDYYWNKLDPQLDHSPYSPEEKNYICEWASKFQENDNIQWKKLQPKVQTKFGKSRSRNSLKNVWNSNKRRTERLAKEVKRNDQLAFPINESGTYTKQEKLELRYLLNDEDENDKNVDMDLN